MKRNQWVAVSVCFVLAVTLWFLVTLNKQTYTTAFDVPVKLVNFPSNFQLLHEFPQEMRIFASGPGIKLLYQDFDPVRDTVAIDFQTFKDKQVFVTHENLSLLNQSLQEEVQAIGAEPDVIQLAYAIKSNKKVPVKLDIEFDLPAAYRVPPDGIEYTDSVIVTGPIDSLAKIKECKTVHIKLPRSIQPQRLVVPWDSIATIEMQPKVATISYTPIPYTEREVRLPVHATGVPVGTNIHFEPDSVTVRLLTPLDQFERIQPSQLNLEVPYREIDARSPYVVPMMKRLAPDVELVSCTPQRVRYLIITRE